MPSPPEDAVPLHDNAIGPSFITRARPPTGTTCLRQQWRASPRAAGKQASKGRRLLVRPPGVSCRRCGCRGGWGSCVLGTSLAPRARVVWRPCHFAEDSLPPNWHAQRRACAFTTRDSGRRRAPSAARCTASATWRPCPATTTWWARAAEAAEAARDTGSSRQGAGARARAPRHASRCVCAACVPPAQPANIARAAAAAADTPGTGSAANECICHNHRSGTKCDLGFIRNRAQVWLRAGNLYKNPRRKQETMHIFPSSNPAPQI